MARLYQLLTFALLGLTYCFAQIEVQMPSTIVVEEGNSAAISVACLGLCTNVECQLSIKNQTAFNGLDLLFNQTSVNLSQASPATIHVQAIDNSAVAPPKELEVELLDCRNSSGAVVIPVASQRATRIILHDDDVIPFDVGFDNSSLPLETLEGQSVQLTLRKSGGSPGVDTPLSITYQVTSGSELSMDVVINTGTVQIPIQATTAHFNITVQDDNLPEGLELVQVIITDVQPSAYGQPDLAARSRTVSIAANDDHQGVFAFDAGSRVMDAAEDDTVTLTVRRTGGTFGVAQVTYTMTRRGSSATPISSVVSFAAGVDVGLLVLSIPGDNISDGFVFYDVVLTQTTIGRISLGNSSALLRIEPSDVPAGVIAFLPDQRTLTISEMAPATTFSVSVRRYAGSTSIIGVQGKVLNGSSDFIVGAAIAAMAEGQTTAELEFTLTDDDIPEPEERFTIVLSLLVGSAIVDSTYNTMVVTVLPSDDAFGVMQFAPSQPTLAFVEPSLANTVNAYNLTVERLAGAFADTTVRWSLEVRGETAASSLASFAQTNGSVTLLEGERMATITLHVLADDVPDNEQLFTVRLLDASNDARVSTANATVDVSIAGNDDGITFEDQDVLVLEDSDSDVVNVTITLVRKGLLASPVTVSYSTVGGTATAGSDFLSATGTVTFPVGVARQSLVLQVVDDPTMENVEVFSVRLSNVQGDAVLPMPSLNISIDRSDGGAGVFGFEDGSRNAALVEGLNEQVNLTVNRLSLSQADTHGTVNLTWSLTAIGSSAPVTDIQPSSGRLAFVDQQVTAVITLFVINDDLPEVDEFFALTLDSVTAPGLLPTAFATSVISVIANDDPFGAVAFVETAPPAWTVNGNARSLLFQATRIASTNGELLLRYRLVYLDINGINQTTHTGASASVRLPGVSITNVTAVIPTNVIFLPGTIVTLQLVSVEVTGTLARSTAATTSPPVLAGNTSVSIPVPMPAIRGTVAAVPVFQRVSEVAGQVTPVTVRLVRTQGFYSDIAIAWQVNETSSSSTEDDLRPRSGTVTMASGSSFGDIALNLTGDRSPEDEESVIIELTSISSGQALLNTSQARATIVIEPSDDPFGLIAFSPAVKPANTLAETDVAGMSVEVFRGGGALGTVNVAIELTPSSSTDVQFTPRSLVFLAGERSKTFFVVALDDIEPEEAESVQLSLKVASTGAPATLGSFVSFVVTVPRNDDASGVFGFSTSSSVVNTVIEAVGANTSFTVNVDRSAGLFNIVVVPWRLSRCASPSILACTTQGTNAVQSSEFGASSGALRFTAFDSQEAITLSLLDNEISSAETYFMLELLTIGTDSNLGRLSTAANATRRFIRVPGNDDPVGFNTTALRVEEDAGQVSLMVTRGGTRLGAVTLDATVQVALATTPIGNQTAGIPPRASQIKFLDGQAVASLVLSLTNDEVAQLDQVYTITLVRSTQDSQDFVLPANTRTATVTVAASDAVAGSFAVEVFGSVARSFQVNETTPARNFTLEVSRGVSLEGNVLVSWSVGPACEGQVLPPNGVLAFVPQQRLATFNLRVVDDDVPELDLDCVVRLDNATVTTPNANSAAIPVGRQSIALTVLESDFPYGVFEVGEASRVLTLQEDTVLTLPVIRKFGAFSNVAVAYSITLANGSYPAAVADNFAPATGSFSFLENQRNRSFTLFLPNDALPEREATFVLQLSVSAPGAAQAGADFARLTVEGSDSPFGMFGFTAPQIVVEEAAAAVNVSAIIGRRRGLFEQVNLTVALSSCRQCVPTSSASLADVQDCTPCNSTSTEDIKLLSPVVTFDENQTQSEVHFVLRADDLPELEYRYIFAIVDVGIGDLNSSINSFEVIVPANDSPYGTFTVEVAPPFSVNPTNSEAEVDETFIQFRILRTSSLALASSVHYEYIVGGSYTASEADLSLLNTSYTGSVTLGADQMFQTLDLLVANDDLPETNETFGLRLFNASDLASIGSQDLVTITIRENDDQNGVFQFANASLVVVFNETDDSTTTRLTVQRLRGTFGSVFVGWRFSGQPEATILAEFGEADGTLLFEEGETAQDIVLSIDQDRVPEVAEQYFVELYVISGGVARFGDEVDARITITGNGDPHGLVQWGLLDFVIAEPVGQDSTFILPIERVGGSIGIINVTVSVTEGTATRFADFESGELVVVQFVDGQTLANFSLTLKQDNVPELDETILIALESAVLVQTTSSGPLQHPSPRIASNTSLTATILENDDARGVFSLRPASDAAVNEGDIMSLEVVRTAGTLADVNVTVTAFLSILCNTEPCAFINQDFTPSSIDVTVPAGVASVLVNFSTIDDTDAEVLETAFFILTSQDRRVRLDTSRTQTSRTIAQSDSPFGLFEVDVASRMLAVNEPETGVTTISVKVNRLQGQRRDIQVSWSLTGTAAQAANIFPVSGMLQINASQLSGMIHLSLPADDVPEVQQTMTLTLTEVDNNAELTPNVTSDITIAPSDAPHGVFGLAAADISLSFAPAGGSNENGKLVFPVERVQGAVGRVRVLAAARNATVDEAARAEGSPLLQEVYLPATTTRLTDASLNISTAATTEADCQAVCLTTPGCGGVAVLNSACEFYDAGVIAGSTTFVDSNSAVHMLKDNAQAIAARFLAHVTADTSANAELVFEDGQRNGTLAIDVFDDLIPEMSEYLVFEITSVTLLDSFADALLPTVESAKGTRMAVVELNDDPFGVFSINQRTVPAVEGTPNSFTLTRSGGSFRKVTISLDVSNQTFASDVSFPFNVVFDEFELGAKPVAVTIVDDVIPELSEDVEIAVQSTSDGRVDAQDRVTFEIEGNDAAGGTIGFATADYSETTQEAIGSSTSLTIPIVREGLNLGTAQAQWTLVPLVANSTVPDFIATSGVVLFSELQASASIPLTLVDDAVPELNESFTIRLSAPQPSAVDISSTKSTMELFVLPDRQAYGVFQFTESSRLAFEGDAVVLTLQRSRGNLGAVDIAVRTVAGTATANLDFVAVSRTVRFAAGQRTATVTVSIIDDTSAELTETLSLEIVSWPQSLRREANRIEGTQQVQGAQMPSSKQGQRHK